MSWLDEVAKALDGLESDDESTVPDNLVCAFIGGNMTHSAGVAGALPGAIEVARSWVGDATAETVEVRVYVAFDVGQYVARTGEAPRSTREWRAMRPIAIVNRHGVFSRDASTMDGVKVTHHAPYVSEHIGAPREGHDETRTVDVPRKRMP